MRTDTVANLIALEKAARWAMARSSEAQKEAATERRQILNRLHEALGTWQKVADATGQKLPTVHKAASQPRKKKP